MRRDRRRSPAAAALACALLAGTATPAGAGDLTVHVDGIRNDRGRVFVTLFTDAKTWLDEDRSVAELTVAAAPGRVTVTFPNLPPGRYGAVTLHDENGNGQMDFDILGVPVEGYAFSRNVRPFLSVPSFDSAAFTIGDRPAEITIRMGY